MSNETAKLGEEQLGQLNELIGAQRNRVATLGDITMQIEFANEKAAEVKAAIKQGQVDLDEFVGKISEEHGEVSINTETGELTKI